MPVNVKDLPPHVRRQITGATARPRRRAEVPASEGGNTLRCECGEVFATYPKAERHAHQEGHTHIALNLEVTA